MLTYKLLLSGDKEFGQWCWRALDQLDDREPEKESTGPSVLEAGLKSPRNL
jgi:hypothetical protein